MVGIRLPIKLVWTMIVVLVFLALTFLILATAFRVVNLLLNPPLKEPTEEVSPRGAWTGSEALADGDISYVSGGASGAGLYVLDLEEGKSTRVIGGLYPGSDLDWSPDGNRIAFEGADGIWTMNADGTERRRLTRQGEPGSYDPAWSPDGQKIAFSSHLGGRPNVNVATPDGSERKVLTDKPAGAGDYRPDWSPDGARIIFMRQGRSSRTIGGIGLPVNDIYVMDADGSDEKRLARGAGDDHPNFSPDGSRIAFLSRRDGDTGVYKMDADGSDVEKLTGNATDTAAPSWSPEGDTIVYEAEGVFGPEIHLVNADDTGASSITDPPTQGSMPVWMP